MIRALGFSLMILTFGAPVHAESTLEMRDSCKGIVDGPAGLDGQILVPTTFEAGTCWGAFSAVQGFGTLSIEGETTGLLRLCMPPAVTRKQLVEVFYRYAGSNPQLLHEDWHYVAWLSIRDAFPC